MYHTDGMPVEGNHQPSKFIVKVNGNVITGPLPSKSAAEQKILSLSESDQINAQIESVTSDGRSILLE